MIAPLFICNSKLIKYTNVMSITLLRGEIVLPYIYKLHSDIRELTI